MRIVYKSIKENKEHKKMNSPFNIKTIRLYRYITYIVISAFVLEDHYL